MRATVMYAAHDVRVERVPDARMGHEFIGRVEEVGSQVRTVKKGDLVVAPFAWSDGTCEFCQHGLQTSCLHGGFWGGTKLDGGQGEAVRVPLADGTLVKLPGRTRSRTDAFATHPHGCDGDRSSRRPRGESRSRQDSGSGWRWCSRPVRRNRCASTRRGAHHHSRQASGSHFTRTRIRRLGCRERARRSGRGARQGAHERTRRTLGARVRGSR